jgi:GlpG protein
MRQVGTLQREQDAGRFVDYLLTLGVEAKADEGSDGWAIWIVDEAHLQRGKDELEDFRRNSDDPKYDRASAARKIRGEAARRDKKVAARTVHMSNRWERPTGGMPLTILLILVSAAATLGSSFGDKADPVLKYLAIAPVFDTDQGERAWIPTHGLTAIRRGEIWRLVTPVFTHFGPIHILFNMMWLYQLGRQIEFRRGPLRLALLVIAIAVLSNFCQYHVDFSFFGGLRTTPHPFFGGMSGVVFGLLGYLWMKSRYDPGMGVFLHPNTVMFMMIWFFLCLSGIGFFSNIANMAHGVGLLVGMAIGYAPHLFGRLSR